MVALRRTAALGVACVACVAVGLSGAAAVQNNPVPEFEVDLETAPELRFKEVLTHFNASIQSMFKAFGNFVVKGIAKDLAEKRGTEPDAELAKEIEGISNITNVALPLIQAAHLLYELNTLMVPIENITWPKLPIPHWSGPGCTGIVALNKQDGMVYHARDLDFSPAKHLQPLVYTAVFKKGGQELYRAQMIAGYNVPLTALKKGPNGFSYEINTRFLDHHGGNGDMMDNLFKKKRSLNGWVVRKGIEAAATYEDFVHTMTTAPLVATQYVVISGVKKGTIISRNPDDVAYQMTLGQTNYQCRDDYIIITNFDYFYHDVREWFDPTGGKGIGHPRRPAAQKILNASSNLTAEVLFSAIDDFEVRAKDTIFQAIINVETGLWNVTMPPCQDCPKDEAEQVTVLV